MTDRCDKCNREIIDKVFGVCISNGVWLCEKCHERWLELFKRELSNDKIKELLNRGTEHYTEAWDRLYEMWKKGFVVPEVVVFT